MLATNLRPAPMFRFFLPHMAALTVWGVAVMLFHTLAHYPERLGVRPELVRPLVEPLWWSDAGVPFAAIAALGSALAIFVGFRNNAAYDRWWEARKIWGGLVNDSRSWARQVLAWAEAPADAADPQAEIRALQTELVHRHLAFVHGLAHHLRKQPEALLDAVRRLVPADEAERYASSPNVITSLLITQGRRVAEARAEGRIEHFRHLELDGMLTRLSDIQGRCERIKNTPLPRQFDAFPRWSVYFYAAVLPFGLVEPIGWGAVPGSVAISVLFLALEASGRLIENPFENAIMDTPMTALSVTIERDLRAALDEPLPPGLQPDQYGVLK